jgi:hypothetical protein
VIRIAAHNVSLDDVHNLPWWAQLSISVGLMAFAALLNWADDKTDSGFLGIASFICGGAGLILLFQALF